jgi:hypothetical protein
MSGAGIALPRFNPSTLGSPDLNLHLALSLTYIYLLTPAGQTFLKGNIDLVALQATSFPRSQPILRNRAWVYLAQQPGKRPRTSGTRPETDAPAVSLKACTARPILLR